MRLKETKSSIIFKAFYLYLLLPFALMQKLAPKNQGCINPWLKINVSVGRKRKLAALRRSMHATVQNGGALQSP